MYCLSNWVPCEKSRSRFLRQTVPFLDTVRVDSGGRGSAFLNLPSPSVDSELRKREALSGEKRFTFSYPRLHSAQQSLDVRRPATSVQLVKETGGKGRETVTYSEEGIHPPLLRSARLYLSPQWPARSGTFQTICPPICRERCPDGLVLSRRRPATPTHRNRSRSGSCTLLTIIQSERGWGERCQYPVYRNRRATTAIPYPILHYNSTTVHPQSHFHPHSADAELGFHHLGT